MTETVTSKNGIAIRISAERWAHITEEHYELTALRTEVLETISRPERVLAGGDGELIAVREFEQGKYMVVVYREKANHGFVITAFLTRRYRSLANRRQLWP